MVVVEVRETWHSDFLVPLVVRLHGLAPGGERIG